MCRAIGIANSIAFIVPTLPSKVACRVCVAGRFTASSAVNGGSDKFCHLVTDSQGEPGSDHGAETFEQQQAHAGQHDCGDEDQHETVQRGVAGFVPFDLR